MELKSDLFTNNISEYIRYRKVNNKNTAIRFDVKRAIENGIDLDRIIKTTGFRTPKFLVKRFYKNGNKEILPLVCVKGMALNDITYRDSAILVENLEAFNLIENIIQDLPDLHKYDIIYTKGIGFYQVERYKKILCLFDWDRAGIEYFSKLKKLNCETYFYTEKHMFDKAYLFGKKASFGSMKKLNKSLRKVCSSLWPVLDYISETKMIVEQEVFSTVKEIEESSEINRFNSKFGNFLGYSNNKVVKYATNSKRVKAAIKGDSHNSSIKEKHYFTSNKNGKLSLIPSCGDFFSEKNVVIVNNINYLLYASKIDFGKLDNIVILYVENMKLNQEMEILLKNSKSIKVVETGITSMIFAYKMNASLLEIPQNPSLLKSGKGLIESDYVALGQMYGKNLKFDKAIQFYLTNKCQFDKLSIFHSYILK